MSLLVGQERTINTVFKKESVLTGEWEGFVAHLSSETQRKKPAFRSQPRSISSQSGKAALGQSSAERREKEPEEPNGGSDTKTKLSVEQNKGVTITRRLIPALKDANQRCSQSQGFQQKWGWRQSSLQDCVKSRRGEQRHQEGMG